MRQVTRAKKDIRWWAHQDSNLCAPRVSDEVAFPFEKQCKKRMVMRSARLSPRRPTGAGNTRADILIDIGTGLVAFGIAPHRAGARLHANLLQAAVSPQAPAPAPTAAPIVSGMPAEGYVRIREILGRKAAKGRPAVLGVIPVSSTVWYAGDKSGRFLILSSTTGSPRGEWRRFRLCPPNSGASRRIRAGSAQLRGPPMAEGRPSQSPSVASSGVPHCVREVFSFSTSAMPRIWPARVE